MMDSLELQKLLHADREAAFFRLRGGYPIPLAGATWWALLGAMGYVIPDPKQWTIVVFYASGLLFPLALLYARLFKVDFMHDKSAALDVLFPTFASMLLFWPIAIAALWTDPQLVPLILAIGLSIHWPVIGWHYARTGIYVTHAVARAIACFILWNWFPSTRFTLLPFTVAAAYLLTVVAILVASTPAKREASLQSAESEMLLKA
jgi:hypothetical protein